MFIFQKIFGRKESTIIFKGRANVPLEAKSIAELNLESWMNKIIRQGFTVEEIEKNTEEKANSTLNYKCTIELKYRLHKK